MTDGSFLPDVPHEPPADDGAGVVIVAAGSSTRMGGTDKISADLGGRPVLAWSLDACERCLEVTRVALVVRSDQREWAGQLVRDGGWKKVVAIHPGGPRRQDSVAAGLQALGGCAWVLVHDAARPFASAELFARCLQAARNGDCGAIAAVPVKDTVKRVHDGRVEATVPREQLWAAQTPQVCRRSTLEEGLAHAEAHGWTVTDEATLCERLGRPVVIVESDTRNFKLTTADDLFLAQAWARHLGRSRTQPAATRMGIGYDVHRLVEGRRLILGGVVIEHTRGLEGHSDADVLLHAIMDALLGAAALGDIGQHFPPTDPAYAGADSRRLLRVVHQKLSSAGYRPANVDATVVAERPRLGPHVPRMRAVIAADLDLTVDCISIKATTNERLGPEGREEGISALAVATLVMSQNDEE